MAVRPEKKLEAATIVTKIVKSGVTVTEGVGVKVSSGGELEVDVAGAGENAYGVVVQIASGGTIVGDGKRTCQVALLSGGCIIPVKASGTATAGAYAICGAGGFENVTLGGGNVVKYVAGKFSQAGVAGDMVGLIAGQFAGVSA